MFRLPFFLPSHQLKRLSKRHIQVSSKLYSSLCQPRSRNHIVQSIRNIHQDVPKKKSRFLLYSLSLATLSTGAVILYAKYDPEYRAWLNETVPGTDEFIKFVTQEEKSLADSTTDYITNVKDQSVAGIFNLVGMGDDKKSESTPTGGKKESKPFNPVKEQPINLKSPEKSQEKPKKTDDTSKKDSSIKRPDLQPQTLATFEVELNKYKREALKAYADAVNAAKETSNEIFRLVEYSVSEDNPTLWTQIKQKVEHKEKVLKNAEDTVQSARQKITELKKLIDSSKIDANKDALAVAKLNVKRAFDELDKTKKIAEKELQTAAVADKYWNKVKDAQHHFWDELSVLFPDIQFVNNSIKLHEEDLDLFLFYAHQHILKYQRKLSELETVGQQKLEAALEQLKLGDPKELSAVISYEVDRERQKLVEELDKKFIEITADMESEIHLQMKRQAEAHHAHLQDAMDLREREVNRKVKREIDETVSAEKEKYKASLAAMVGRMRGLTQGFEKKVEQDKLARQSLALWSACQSLLNVVSAWSPDIPWSEQLKPLKSEVEAIKKAGQEDELVDAVVKAIPDEALTRGVFPENALKQRFFNVERTAYRVAIVPEGGASLAYVFLSFLQSFLIIRAANPIPASELADEPVDFSKLDNYDILQRARYWLDRGDLAQTLKYMNLLKGGARAVASDWIKEARLLLETKQAAETLVFHSTSNGLIYS